MMANNGTKRIFVAATGQHEGKTTVSLGLLSGLERRWGPVGFMKPIGQRSVEVDGRRVNEDCVLLNELHRFGCDVGDLSPVSIDSGFTRRYIDDADPEPLTRRIRESYGRVAEGRRAVVIEGTGHAGVGSVIDLSNAHVARMLDAPVLLVSRGGIGAPIDRVMLNRSLFERHGVDVIGVVLNKVLPSKLEMVKRYAAPGLERFGIPFLGAIPFDPLLATPTVGQLARRLEAEVLGGGDELDRAVTRVAIGEPDPDRSAGDGGTLLILRATRAGDVFAPAGETAPGGLAGVVLTGKREPAPDVMQAIRRAGAPVLRTTRDCFEAAARVHAMVVKTRSCDARKVRRIRELVEEHVDIDVIASRMNQAEPDSGRTGAIGRPIAGGTV